MKKTQLFSAPDLLTNSQRSQYIEKLRKTLTKDHTIQNKVNNMTIVRNLENLNLKTSSKEADNDTIFTASNIWYNYSMQQLSEYFNCNDIDALECIRNYLTDQSFIAEGLTVEIWFN